MGIFKRVQRKVESLDPRLKALVYLIEGILLIGLEAALIYILVQIPIFYSTVFVVLLALFVLYLLIYWVIKD